MGRLEVQLGAIVAASDYDVWRCVPDLVVKLYKSAAPAASRLAAWAARVAGPEDRLWWHPATRTAWAQVTDIEKRADWEQLPDIPGVPDVALYIEPIGPPPVAGWVLVKTANGYLEPLARPGQAIQKAMGGPTGLTEAIVNGLIGGGLGYGAGWIADQFLPEEHVQKGRLPLTMGLTGLGLGVVPGLWQYSAERRAKNLPPGATGAPAYPGYPLPRHKPTMGLWPGPVHLTDPATTPQLPPGPARPSVLDPDITKLAAVHPWFHKAAQNFSTGALLLPSIPVDAFNRVVWNDVRYPPNAFGTRSPWGTNEQPMGTPPYAAAATTGLLAGTAQAAGSPVVSPWQVASSAAVGAGKGWLTGLAAGKILGALAGLKPEAQAKLQDVGIWGGLITGVANSLYA